MYKLLLLLFLTSFSNLKGQEVIQHYTTSNGLAHDVVYNILQDKNGIIWFATDNGLSQFNGGKFSNFRSTIPKSNYIIDFIETDSNLILGTWGAGILSFKNGEIIDCVNCERLKVSYLKAISDSTVLIKKLRESNTLEIYNYNQDTLYSSYNVSNNNELMSIADSLLELDKALHFGKTVVNKRIWLHAFRYKLKSYDFHLKGVYEVRDGELIPILFQLSNMYITAIKKQDSILWTTNNTCELIKIKDNIILDRIALGIKDNIADIKVHKNTVYLLTNTHHLYSYNEESKQVKNLTKRYNITSKISSFFVDKDSHLWIATNGSGIYKIQEAKNKFIGDNILQSTNVKDLFLRQDTIILLSTEKLSMIKNDSLIMSINIRGCSEYFEPHKTYSNVEIFQPNWGGEDYIHISGQTDISIIFNREWAFKSKKGTFIVTKSQITFENLNKEQKQLTKLGVDYNISNVKLDSNYIYVLTPDSGLYVYNYDGQPSKVYNRAYDFPTNDVNDFILDEDTIWLATDNGLFKVYNDTFNQYHISNGLKSDKVNSIIKDKYNVLWIGTNKGLNILKEGKKIYSISNNYGQFSSLINKIIQHENNIYVLGNKGIYIHDNSTEFRPSSKTKIIFNQDNADFSIYKINYTNFYSIKTEYKLNNQPWKAFHDDQLSFRSLKEGFYFIQFRYKDDLSEWVYSKTNTFSIIEPWYYSPWIYIMCSFITMFFIYKKLLIVKRKNKHYIKILEDKDKLKNELKDIRSNIARDFHDDLGNKLTIISVLSQAEYKKQKDEKSLKNLHRIQLEVDSLYDSMNDFIWALDNKNSFLHELSAYLNDFGEQLFEYTDITFLSTNNLSDDNQLLPPYWNKQIILLFKEGMTNILKHSKGQNAFLDINLENNILLIILKDDGKGFDYDSLPRKNGLNNMKLRMRSIEAELDIKSDDGVMISFKGDLNIIKDKK